MKETVREPLLLFLVLGAVLYGAWALLAPGDVGTVRIEAAALRGMEAQQTEILGRPLTDAERHDLFEGYIDDEVLLREAVRRGLQWSDFRARQRLVRIMRGALTETVPDPSVGGAITCRAPSFVWLMTHLPAEPQPGMDSSDSAICCLCQIP